MIYLDEELPEIEITEIITGDEYAKYMNKSGLNIYSEEEILKQLLLLLAELKSIPVARKASVFQKLHADIIAVKTFNVPDFIVPEVSIQRRDNGDDEEFIEAYDEAHKINRYDTRQEALRKAFIGFETTDEEEPVLPSGLPPTNVFIKDTNQNMTVILPTDDLTGTVTQLFTKIYSNDGLTLVDKINMVVRISDEAIKIDPTLTLEENISQIKQYKDDDPDDIVPKKPLKNLKPSKNYHSAPLTPLNNCGIHGFYITQKNILDKLKPILKNFKDDLIDLYYSFIDANVEQVEFVSTIPNNAFDIAMMLLEQQTTIKDVIETIKARIFLKQKKFIEEWYALIEAWNLDEIVLSTELELANKTVLSINDEPNEQWDSIVEEIKYIKRGEVISKDFVDKNVFQNTNVDGDVSIDDDDELPPLYDDSLPVDISYLDEGSKELYEIVLKMFVVLKKASGLPLDYLDLTKSLPLIVRRTRAVEKKTDNEFIKELQSLWVYLLAWWICALQTDILSYRLQFQTWQGSGTCMHVWSPYGMPMEKPQKEGLVPYFICVCKELMDQEGTLWKKYTNIQPTELHSLLSGLFSKEFKTITMQLQTTFKTFDKDLPLKNLVKKGADVKDKLTQTVKDKNKANYITDYMSYLRNLPAVLVGSNIRNGCCVQKISDIHNEKNTYLKNAYKLKQLFATERIGIEKRPVLVMSGIQKPLESPTSTIVFNKPKPKIYDEWNATNIPDVRSIEKILDIVGKTAAIDSQLKDFIFKIASASDLLQAIVKLAQIQYLQIQTSHPELHNDFMFYDLEVNTITNEVQSVKYTRQLQHHFVRMLCFPAKPENARNNTLVLMDDGYDASLLSNFVKHSVAEIKAWVFYKIFNKTVNYSDYISKVREQENNNKLKIIDRMSPEERELYKTAKKIGIFELKVFVDSFDDNKTEEAEEEQFQHNGMNDDEVDDDELYDE
jgi:hypothetical protein